MNKKEITEFFDNLADSWDSNQIRKDDIINKILDISGIEAGKKVLDVGCGTGVLFPYYLERGVLVTAVDISSKMTGIAKVKFPEVKVICADAEEENFNCEFDIIMVHNAFPHFPNPEKLIENLTKHLKPSGRLTIAHSLSREALLHHHSGSAQRISLPLPEADELAKLIGKYLKADDIISDSRMYVVSGIKEAKNQMLL